MKLLTVKWTPSSGENPIGVMAVPAGAKAHRPYTWDQAVMAEVRAAFNSQDYIGACDATFARIERACFEHETLQSNRRADAIILAERKFGIERANAIADAFADANGLN